MSNSIFSTRKLVTLAVLSGLGTALMFLEIPYFTEWLKFDLSDLTVYVSAVVFGPVGAILVAFIKSLIHYIIKGGTAGVPINQVAAFVASVSYAIPFYYTIQLVKKMFKNNPLIIRIIPTIIGSISLAIVLTTLNYYWITPFFMSLMGWPLPDEYLKFIVMTYIPFNLFKGAVLSFIFILISFRLDYVTKKLHICDEDGCTLLNIE